MQRCGRLLSTLSAPMRRAAHTGKREFWQRLDEQHLAHELKSMSRTGHASDGGDGVALFDPKIQPKPVRRLTAANIESGGLPSASEASGGSSGSRSSAFRESPRRKPWLEYESLRGETYPGGRAGPKFQDLTHNEAQRLQEMYMRKRMLDRKILWMKMQDLPNPQKEAKMTLRRTKREEEAKKAAARDSLGGTMYPPPFLDQKPDGKRFARMEEEARREELESRFRARIRQEKLENARLLKTPPPKVGDFTTDPIERHVNRRLLRQRSKIHGGLEEFLTRNSTQILHEFLRGVAVSIVKIRAKTPMSTQQIYYSITSDHDPAWVQNQLNIVAPKLRSQLALKENMGKTPNIQFVPYVHAQEVRREFIWPIARQLQEKIPPGGGFRPSS